MNSPRKRKKGILSSEFNRYLFQRQNFRNTALIDGDIIVYRVGFAAEKDGEVDTLANTLHSVKVSVNSISEKCRARNVRVFLSGRTNFRDEVATTAEYKGTRPDRKPYWYREIQEYLQRKYGAVVSEGIEADDLMAIEAQKDPDHNVICTLDKDLDCVPGWHFDWVKENLYWVDETEALRNFYKQMVTGDRIDNIVGLYRKGEKYAQKLLDAVDDPDEMARLVHQEYVKEFGKDADSRFQENQQLLWIIRNEQDVPQT